MRVLITGPAERPGQGGGIAKHVEMIAAAMSESPKWRLVRFASSYPKAHKGLVDRGLGMLRALWLFPGALKSCDLVHINSTIEDRSLARDCVLALLARMSATPVIVQFHGGSPLLLSAAGRAWLRRYNSATGLYFLTTWQLEEAESLGLRGGRLIANAVPAPKTERVESPDFPRLLCMSRLVAGKGVSELLEAFGHVDDPGATLVIAGDGELLDDLRLEASGDHRVRFAGWIDGEAKDELMASSDVLVVPSHREAMPYAVLEGLAQGLAIIASDAVEIASDIAALGAGICVASGSVDGYREALVRVVDESESVVEMQRRAKELWSERYTIDQLGHALNDAWSRAIG